jgi:NDP-sugar pyrophosphorylase family protein
LILIDLDPLLLNYSEPFPLIILAGGAGTRLNKINKDIPKIMTPIGNRIFLDYFMDNLKKLGFNELYFLIFPDEKKTY